MVIYTLEKQLLITKINKVIKGEKVVFFVDCRSDAISWVSGP